MGTQYQSLIIRADANTQIGTGHLMRCLALAQAWKAQGGSAIFITACKSDFLLQRLHEEEFQVTQLEKTYPDPTDWEITSQVLTAHPGAWVVLDGYYFDEAYQKRVKQAGHRLLVIDDMAHLDHYYADVVLNQNINAEKLWYSCEPYTQPLLGTQYVLLRREFLQWRDWNREIPAVARKVLVTLGGGDPDNVTLKIIRAINKLKLRDLEVKVVIGPSNPHMVSLKEAIHYSPFTIQLLPAVRNMPELMAWADIAISAGGTTCWELAFMGVPTITLELAKNQQGIASGLDKARLTLNLGWHTKTSIMWIANRLLRLLEDRKLRLKMSQKSRLLVDGLGGVRVVEFLLREHSNLEVS